MKKLNGFTLAEVLITLLIIGVVASIVIPNLLNDINDAELRTTWKKVYAEMASAYNQAKIDNGGTLAGACTDANNNCLRNLVMPYLSYIKSCDNSLTNGSNLCLYNTMSIVKTYYGSQWGGAYLASSLQLNDGAIVIFAFTDQACDMVINSSNVRACGAYGVDINGYKGPNTIGRDSFYGWITKDGTLPIGALDQENAAATLYNAASCDKTNPAAVGWGCSAKFLYQ